VISKELYSPVNSSHSKSTLETLAGGSPVLHHLRMAFILSSSPSKTASTFWSLLFFTHPHTSNRLAARAVFIRKKTPWTLPFIITWALAFFSTFTPNGVKTQCVRCLLSVVRCYAIRSEIIFQLQVKHKKRP